MLAILRRRTFRHLFLAQVVALVGTGLATVALGLLALRLAGDRAGLVLGTALFIKMVAYVTLAPIAVALAERLPRRGFLVALDLVRAGVVAALPFVDAIWQVYVLIFILQAASAGFTPAFQAMLPDVLADEDDYTNALSLMRLSEDMEQLVSPLAAAALLTVVSFPMLFAGTVAGFLASAGLILTAAIPARGPAAAVGFATGLSRGIRVYLATPRLRGLMVMECAVAAAGAMVYVNTVVLVEVRLGLGAPQVALAFAAFGAGSMLAALAVPRLLRRVPERRLMLAGAGVMVLGVALAAAATGLASVLPVWALIGAGFALSQTPIGRILTRSSTPADRPAVFAAQFALSHAAWLVAYPLAGWLGAERSMEFAALALAALGAVALAAASRLWPAEASGDPLHDHPDLAPDHPHLRDHGAPHRHPVVIDDLHRRWPALSVDRA